MTDRLKSLFSGCSAWKFESFAALGIVCGAAAALRILPPTGSAALLLTAAAAAFRLGGKIRGAVFASALVLTLGSAFLRETERPGHWEKQTAPGKPCAMELQVRITDENCSGSPAVPEPKFLAAEVLARKTEDAGWIPAHGKIYLCRSERDAAAGRKVFHHGAVLELRGTAVPAGVLHAAEIAPDGTREFRTGAGMADFDAYLAARGAKGVFHPDSVRFLRDDFSLLTRLLQIRDRGITIATRKIADERTRKLVSAMFFGCRQGLSKLDRRAFVAAGTVHIFAVSGMHVAVLAGILLLVLRGVPFRLRCRILFVVLGLYVLSTGANAPAVRAFLMIGAWCLLRSALCYLPTTRILLLSGCALLLFNPFYLGDAGFLFSFLVTAALLFYADHEREFRRLADDRKRYSAVRGRDGAIRSIPRRMASALGACGTAFLAGSAVNLAAFGLFLPGSVLANFLMIPILAVLFPCIVLKILFAFLPFADTCFAFLTERLFGAIAVLMQLSDAVFGRMTLVHPPTTVIVLFAVGFFLLLRAKKPLILGAGALLLALGVGCAVHLKQQPRLNLTVCSADSGENISLLLTDSAADFAAAVNTPGRDGAAALLKDLSLNGAGKLDLLFFSDVNSPSSRSLDAVALDCRIARIVRPGRGGTLAKKLENAPLAPETVIVDTDGRFHDSSVDFLAGKERWQFAYFNPATNSKVCVNVEQSPTRRRVTVSGFTPAPTVCELGSSNLTEIRHFGKAL